MPNSIKRIFFFELNFYFLTCCFLALTSCQSKQNNTAEVASNYINIAGRTMGTSYSIKANTTEEELQNKVDALLLNINVTFSTYDSLSLISQLNNASKQTICIEDKERHFFDILSLAKEVNTNTNGYFDPTVLPLVKYWGFGPNKIKHASVKQASIDSLLAIVGLSNLEWKHKDEKMCLHKQHSFSSIDLNAIAKGKGIDIIAEMFEVIGIIDYMIEIGGEVRVKGKNNRGLAWQVAIDKPKSTNELNNRQSQAIIRLTNESIASSGNYRNFHEIDGKIIGHTINPKTGYPETNDLLGVSVIAKDCATADAYATGFMAMGFEKAKLAALKIPTIKVFFIKIGEDGSTIETKSINGFDENIVLLN